MQKLKHAGKNVGSYSRVKNIEEDGFEDVYCIYVPETGNFLANGIVVKNCDALRYAVASTFPTGELCNLCEDLSIDQLKKYVYGNDSLDFNPQIGLGGYI